MHEELPIAMIFMKAPHVLVCLAEHIKLNKVEENKIILPNILLNNQQDSRETAIRKLLSSFCLCFSTTDKCSEKSLDLNLSVDSWNSSMQEGGKSPDQQSGSSGTKTSKSEKKKYRWYNVSKTFSNFCAVIVI